MLREEQIDLRKARARAAHFTIRNLGRKRVFSDYLVSNPESGGEYTVNIRSFRTGDNACTCPDFKANTLGTCKHIEAVLDALNEKTPEHVKGKKAEYPRPEIYLDYGDPKRPGLHLPARHSDKLASLAKRYFDSKGLWSGRGVYQELIVAVEAIPEEVTVHSDALDFIGQEIDRAQLLSREKEYLEAEPPELLKLPLYDYQFRGAVFLACRGRSILGDDMGLGKTVQTLAAVEILVRERNIGRVLVIAPASVKYQWETEITRLTNRSVQIVEGDKDGREAIYNTPTFYRLVNYEQVVKDLNLINDWSPDLIVLDEAQRIRNWESKTSRAVKKLRSRYAIVLTGTPLENRLEELYSIVQFVDERRFGPAFQFLNDHRLLDEQGNLKGYRDLEGIRDKLEPIFLRRTRAEVLTELPARSDTTRFVELSAKQKPLYDDQQQTLAKLIQRGYHTDVDRKRILACLTNLRMICDSASLYDETVSSSPKLDEFAILVPELLEDDDRKIVVFSQWETMIRQAAKVLETLSVGHAVLHGSLSGPERQKVLERFRNISNCRVLLSTDAGGVGLNLQQADTVINLELPWNPALLNQRIARVHRLGQSRPVRVLNFVTRGTVEERVLRTLEKKQQLFDELFTGEEDEIAFEGVSAAGFAARVKKLLFDPLPAEPAPPPAVSHLHVTDAVALLESLSEYLAKQPLDEALKKRVHEGLKIWR